MFRRFAQILNVGDHWILVTNAFTSDLNLIYIDDSLYHTINDSERVQISVLLRRNPDEIVLHLRTFPHQDVDARTCGYFACVALFLTVNSVEPSYLIDDIVKIKELYFNVLNNYDVNINEYINTNISIKTIKSETLKKTICFCNKKNK